MALKLERFTKTCGSFAPIISIRKGGALGLSQGALNRFQLMDGAWFVVLYYDREASVIGIQPTKRAEDEGAIKLIKRKSKAPGSERESISSSISAKAFFEYYNIPCDAGRSFPSSWDAELKMIIVELNSASTKS